MKRDEIMKLAKEAGLLDGPVFAQGLECFAALVAAAEREACAKVCDANKHYFGYQCAEAIRARGQDVP